MCPVDAREDWISISPPTDARGDISAARIAGSVGLHLRIPFSVAVMQPMHMRWPGRVLLISDHKTSARRSHSAVSESSCPVISARGGWGQLLKSSRISRMRTVLKELRRREHIHQETERSLIFNEVSQDLLHYLVLVLFRGFEVPLF